MNNNSPQQDINLHELLILIYQKKLFISCMVSFSIIISAYVALKIPNKFTSSSILYVNENINSKQSDSIGGLASIVGITGSSSSTKSDLAREIIFSRLLLDSLLKNEDFLVKIYAASSYDKSTSSILYDKNIYDSSTKKWLEYNKKGVLGPPTTLQAQKKFNKIIQFNVDNNTGFIEISATHYSPKFAHDLLVFVIDELNRISSSNALNDSQESITFLKEKLLETKQLELRESLTRLITVQLEQQMMATVQSEYLLKFLDKPFIPESKVSPSRSLIVILSTLGGFIISIIYILVASLFSTRTQLKTIK